jgi:hypothetical protein
MSGPAALRWLFVVQAGEPMLFDRLTQRLAGVARVVLDRRRGPRRQRRGPVPTDRRHRDRRRTVSAGVTPALGTGYHLVYHSANVDVYKATDPSVPAVCPTCSMVLAFDMPHFAQPPAHVEITVDHRAAGERVEHAVEVHATAATGHPLLACRLAARRHAWQVDDRPEES